MPTPSPGQCECNDHLQYVSIVLRITIKGLYVHVRTNTFEYHCIQLTYMCFMIIIKGAHWD